MGIAVHLNEAVRVSHCGVFLSLAVSEGASNGLGALEAILARRQVGRLVCGVLKRVVLLAALEVGSEMLRPTLEMLVLAVGRNASTPRV